MTQPTPRRRRLALVHAAVIAIGLLPFGALAGRAALDSLGANPIEEITHETGEWALRFLLLALAITPLRLVFGWRGIAPYRRTFGLFAFFYASLHFSTYVGLDLFFEWDAIVEDVIERPYVTAGFTAFLCLLPLAITSTRGWVRRLGRRWILLHRLAYVAGVAAVVHFLWLVKADLREPLIYATILASLFSVRVWDAARRRAAKAALERPA